MVTTRANWLLRLKEATSSPPASMVGAPRTLSAIDSILEGKTLKAPEPVGPLLMKIGKSARFLDVSRMTFRRMRKKRELQKVEILPGSSWLRRSDLEAITEKTPSLIGSPPHLIFKKWESSFNHHLFKILCGMMCGNMVQKNPICSVLFQQNRFWQKQQNAQ